MGRMPKDAVTYSSVYRKGYGTNYALCLLQLTEAQLLEVQEMKLERLSHL